MLCEASETNDMERRFLQERGWMTLSNRYGDILIGAREIGRLDTGRGSP